MPHCQATAILIRHADVSDTPAGDPDLNPAGAARAQGLRHILRDAKVQQIFATQTRRSQQTASPLAADLDLPISDGGDIATLVQHVCSLSPSSTVLVVGHSNTLGPIIAGLGGPPISDIGATEFDNLFVVSAGRLTHLRYTH